MTSPQQIAIPAVYVRGGTSRALVFHGRDLPAVEGPDRDRWARIFAAALGSPDPKERQLDGLGGGISSLSKVAIVAPSKNPAADVDYTFGQVSITGTSVSYRGNCGNISAAIGPFAVDEGLVVPDGERATVRILNTNTNKLIHADFGVVGGKAAVEGSFSIQGVAGTGAPIRLSFLDPAGAATGKLLPTDSPTDRLVVPGFGAIECSLVDAVNPVVFVAAKTLSLSGGEAPAEIGGNRPLMERLESIRIEAALRMGIVASNDEARTVVTNLPLVALISRPDGEAADLRVRMISAGQPHKATPLSGAMCLAVAAKTDGTIPHGLLASATEAEFRVAHASGVLPVGAELVDGMARNVIVYRTARRLMEGRVLVPTGALNV
jgi:2-methylaconitate cis-trans-isomerase PrpF